MSLTSKPVTANASWKTLPKFTDSLEHSMKGYSYTGDATLISTYHFSVL